MYEVNEFTIQIRDWRSFAILPSMQQPQQTKHQQPHQQQQRDGVVINNHTAPANIVVKTNNNKNINNNNTLRRCSGGSRTSSESSNSDVVNNGAGSPLASPSEAAISSPTSGDVTVLRTTPSSASVMTMDPKTQYSGVATMGIMSPTDGIVSASAAVNSWHPHVYAKPPRTPTPHFISDIMGWGSRNSNNNNNNNDSHASKKPSPPLLVAPTPIRATPPPLLVPTPLLPPRASPLHPPPPPTPSLTTEDEDEELSNEPLNLTTKSRDASPTSSIGSMMGVTAARTLTPPMPPQLVGKPTPNHLLHHRPPPFREPPINGIDCTARNVTMNGRPHSDVTSSSPVAANAIPGKGAHPINRSTHLNKGKMRHLTPIVISMHALFN